MTEEIHLFLERLKDFVDFSFTAFYFYEFCCKDDFHLEGLIFTGALRYFEDLQSFLFEISKSASDCFLLFVFEHGVNNQSQLYRKVLTLGKLS